MPTINLDRPSKKYLDNGTRVWSRYAIELADNGQSADACLSLMIAPSATDDQESQFIYLETNGDPVIIGWIDRNGDLELSDWAREEVNQVCGDSGPDESHPSYWIFDALLSHGFEL